MQLSQSHLRIRYFLLRAVHSRTASAYRRFSVAHRATVAVESGAQARSRFLGHAAGNGVYLHKRALSLHKGCLLRRAQTRINAAGARWTTTRTWIGLSKYNRGRNERP